MADLYDRFHAPDRQTWRDWLAANHATSKGIYLVYFKKLSGKPSITYEEAVLEALCWGWIDSRALPIDADSHMQTFTPRRPRSIWSKINKARIESLEAAGLIREPGRRVIEIAKQNGSWTALDEVEELTMPPDLEEALAADEAARTGFDSLPPSTRKQLLWHVASAKRPETRTKRIEQVVTAGRERKNPLLYTPKQSAGGD